MKKKKKQLLILYTIFFFIILSLTPISGDDWGNFITKTNIINSLKKTFELYFTWEGRITSRLLISILTPNKILWNIINALSITTLLHLSIKIIKPKNKIIYLLILLIIPLMNLLTFSETITFIAGNLTYFIEIPFILLYYMLIYKEKHKTKLLIPLIILSIAICTTVEHIAGTLIIGNIIILIYNYQKTKKIDKQLITLTIIGILSTLIMYISPGSRYRMSVENIEFNKLNIIQKINYNIPSFIYYTFITNYYLLILWSISNYLIIKNKIQKRKKTLAIFLTIIPIITIIIYPITIIKKITFINNTYLTIYYIIFLVISLILNMKENNKKSTFLFVLGICANGIMLLSPTWGYRTSLFTYITLTLSNIIIISKYIKQNKLIETILKIILILISISYLFIYINVYRCQIDNKKYIKSQLKEDKQTIEILKFPYFVNCNINPNTDYHNSVYKKYYNIPEEKKLKQIDKWKYSIIYKK